MMPNKEVGKIQTVKGANTENNFKIVDAHVHLWAKKDISFSDDGIPEVNDQELIENNLIDFKKIGGSLAIDCTPFGCGRNGNFLFRISNKTGIEIVCVTGFHIRQYYPSDSVIWHMDFKSASDFFKKEIKTGLKETLDSKNKVKAGIIKIPFIGEINDEYKNLTNAAINAAAQTGIPILVHTEKGKNVEFFADYLEEKGIKPHKVVFCHLDKRNEISLHEKLALRGFYLEYDTFLREKYEPEKNAYNLIKTMVNIGFEKSILLGSDISDNAMWEKVNLSKGYGGFFNKLKNDLSIMIKDADTIFNLIGGNAVRLLSKN